MMAAGPAELKRAGKHRLPKGPGDRRIDDVARETAMPILKRLLFHAARRLATDPQARQIVIEIYRDQVRPRAAAAWEKAKPRIEETRADIGRIAEETDARHHPARFAGRAARRILGELKPRPKAPQ